MRIRFSLRARAGLRDFESPRRAAALVEALVAIAVMAFGLLSILSLFILGLVNMAQANRDERAAQAATNASALAEVMDVRNDPLLFTAPLPNDVFVRPFPGASPPDLSTIANYTGSGYPVYVDPYGLQTGPGRLGQVLAGAALPFGSSGVARRSVSYVVSNPRPTAAIRRWFTLQDDMNFLRDGPATGLPCLPGGVVERENRYSWAYLLRRPRLQDRSVVEMSIVVYSGRPASPAGEVVYAGAPGNPVRLVADASSVIVTWNPAAGEEPPPVRPGSWILDATMVHTTPPPAPANAPFRPDPHGFFYRVVAVNEVGTLNGYPAVELELQNGIRAGTDEGVLVVMEGVVEVFEKGPGGRP